MHETLRDPVDRIAFCARSEKAEERSGSNLGMAADSHPSGEALRLGTQDAVALRMRDDGPQTRQLQMMEHLIHCRRDREFVELHEQIIFLVDAKLCGRLFQGSQIFGIQMEVAACGELQTISEFCL